LSRVYLYSYVVGVDSDERGGSHGSEHPGG
jgi:hypothetical protein